MTIPPIFVPNMFHDPNSKITESCRFCLSFHENTLVIYLNYGDSPKKFAIGGSIHVQSGALCKMPQYGLKVAGLRHP